MLSFHVICASQLTHKIWGFHIGLLMTYVLWNVMQCHWVSASWQCKGTQGLHLLGWLDPEDRHCEPLQRCKLLILRHNAVSQKTWILNKSYFGIRTVTAQTSNVNVLLYWQQCILRGYSYRSDMELAHRTLKVQSHIVCAWFHNSPGAHVCFIGLPLTQM